MKNRVVIVGTGFVGIFKDKFKIKIRGDLNE